MANMLFDTDGKPTEALLEVLSICGVDHDGTLVGIRNSTQSIWYQAGKIRANIEEEHADLKTALMPHFKQLGLIDKVRAKSLKYDTALLLGATIVAVRKRLAFLIGEWDRGVRFKRLVFIGSSRKLTSAETPEVMLDAKNPDLPFNEPLLTLALLPKTEGDMMWLVHDLIQAQLPWRYEAEATFAIHPGQANTVQTIEHWFTEAKPDPASLLAVSSQPFVADQELAVRKVLPPGFQIEAIGYSAPPSIKVSVFLDALAKLIYKLAGGN